MSINLLYINALKYLDAKINYEAFQNPAVTSYKMSLENLKNLDKKIGTPHQHLKIIHVAGTKGKGSVCMYLEHYLRNCGYSTGLFTSPHLYQVNERVKLNGKSLSDTQFAEMITDFQMALGPENDKNLSYFETMTLASLLYFKKNKIDWILLETGLGGRLDATNIVNPILSVITRIDIDHTHLLGNTHELIATEKAGIIKEKTPVAALRQREDVNHVIEMAAKRLLAPLIFTDSEKSINNENEDLNSAEIENLLIVKTVLKKINEIAKIEFDEIKIKQLTKLKLPGRYETFPFKNKTILMDVAHNYISYQKLIEKITLCFPGKKIAFAFNSSRDKDILNMGALIKQNFKEVYILPVQNNPRIFKPNELFEILQTGQTFDNLNDGINTIIDSTNAEILVFTGSFYLISEVGKFFNREIIL